MIAKQIIYTSTDGLQTEGSFQKIAEYFYENNCWGLLTSIDVKNCQPDLIRSTEAIQEYVIHLCALIKVKRFQETKIVHFGEEERIAGYSMVQLIETSLVSGHFANASNTAYIDIFSCKIYDPYTAVRYTKEFFHAEKAIASLCFRR